MANLKLNNISGLWAWRQRVLNLILTAAIFVAVAPLGVITADAMRKPTLWPATSIFWLLYIVVLVLAVWRRLGVRWRAWGLLALGYAAALLSMARGGLAGDGRIYLVALPFLALILLGERSGAVMLGISLMTYVVFMLLAHWGHLENWLILSKNPVTFDAWLTGGIAMLMTLSLLTLSLWQFYRFQMRTLEDVQQTAKELELASLMAESANRAKSKFLENVSHELRTPLTSVVGFTRMIEKRLDRVIFPAFDNLSPDAPENKRLFRTIDQIHQNSQIIIQEAERLTALVDDILDLEQLQSDQVKWKIVPLQIDTLINKVSKSVALHLADKPVDFVLDVAMDLPPVLGDVKRLTQVLGQLYANAMKFTQKGKIVCSVMYSIEDDAVLVSISDTGIGIAKEHYDKVFVSFEQVGDGLIDKPTGTGLGLPICKAIIEHLGGRIGFESAIGKGSTFYFTVPCADCKLEEDEPEPMTDENE